MKNIKVYVAAALLILTASCITPRRVNYLQDMTQGSQVELENRFEARVAPYDELSIVVSTSQMSQDMAAPFNNNTNYLVDVDGNIDFPVVGALHVAGLTRLQIQDSLSSLLERGGYLDEPFVMVRFANFKIFFIGQINKVITVPNERCTFLEALAMAGGLDNYARRDRIAVMREIDGRMVTRYLDPRSSDVFNDPFYMLQQNDFIVTESYSAGTLRSEFSSWLGFFSTLLSFATFGMTIMLYRNK